MFNNGPFTEAEGMFTRKDLMKLLAPLIVEQILAVLVGMVDVMMVAAVGEAAVSGVSLVDSISVLTVSYTHLDVYKRQGLCGKYTDTA